MRSVQYPPASVLLSVTLNPLSSGVVILADVISRALLRIRKEVRPIVNLDKNASPAVEKDLVRGKAEEASPPSSALKERITCCGVRRTTGVSSRGNPFHS